MQSTTICCQSHKLLEQLLDHRFAANSPSTRDASEQCQEELRLLQEGSAFEQFVAWYYQQICSGYGYLIRTKDGIRARQGWIRPSKLMKHLGGKDEPSYIAIRPPTMWSNWAAVDIDQGSPYHPDTAGGVGLMPVVEALKETGLCEGLEFQSSSSGGRHIWYPICKPVRTWDLAVAMVEACKRNQLEIGNGKLELRPNCKGFGAQYLAIRAPLSGEGNGLIMKDFGIVENHTVLMLQWNEAQKGNHINKVQGKEIASTPSSNRRGQQRKGGLDQAEEILEVGFTGKSQTQQIKLAAMQKARLIEGLNTETSLKERSHQLIEEAPGFEEHCRHKQAIKNRCYISRTEVKKALSLIPGGYKGTWKEKANTKKKANSEQQAQVQIQRMRQGKLTYRTVTEAFIDIKENGGPSRAWWYKKENRSYMSALKSRIGS